MPKKVKVNVMLTRDKILRLRHVAAKNAAGPNSFLALSLPSSSRPRLPDAFILPTESQVLARLLRPAKISTPSAAPPVRPRRRLHHFQDPDAPTGDHGSPLFSQRPPSLRPATASILLRRRPGPPSPVASVAESPAAGIISDFLSSLMSTMGNDEPSTAPPPDRWFPLTLGSSFKDHPNPSSKFCTLRYEFKPASIDKTQPGTLHKNKENRVAVEFHNNQPGKPKVTFEGSSEDYKESDGVLFFDGHQFRLERLHRSFKRLRHIRLPGESNAAVATSSAAAVTDTSSPPVAKGGAKVPNLVKSTLNPVPVEVERIDIGNSGNSATYRHDVEKLIEVAPSNPIPSFGSPDDKVDDLEEELDILDDDDDVPQGEGITGIDINNMPHQIDTDDEIADVDVNLDDTNTGRNAAEALRAQVNAEQALSSSDSSGSDSSGSGSGSSSDSESSDGNTVDSI